MLGNIDMEQISQMMGNITGDETASKEFSQVFSKISDVVKDGGNPMEAMGELIKQASVNQASSEPVPETTSNQVPDSELEVVTESQPDSVITNDEPPPLETVQEDSLVESDP